MRRSIIPLCLALFFFSCKSKSGQPAASQTDSFFIDLPAPQKISDAELAGYTHKVNDLFDRKLINRNFNGAIIIAKGGNIIYERYVGFTDPRAKTAPITDSSSFHLASTSKPFTAMAVLRLVQQGKIHLDDDVTQYFPAFPYPGVTVKYLLSHRSGLPNYLYFMEDKEKWPASQMVNNNDVLDFMIKYKPDLSYRTGSRFSYCNTNYVLLALILEKVTGMPYPEYMSKTIFKPLRMEHTFVYTPTDSGRVIMSYKPSGTLWEQDIFDHTYGDKNIYSTPRDLLKWDAALYSEEFISQSLIDSAYQPLSNESPSTHNYGLGWRMLNLPNGKKVIYHNGKWHGFNPAFGRLLDEKAVIIILGNQYNSNIYHSAKLAYNIFGDYLQNDNEADEEAAVAPVVVAPKKAKAPVVTKAAVKKPKATTSKTAVKKSTKPTSKKQSTTTSKKTGTKRKA